MRTLLILRGCQGAGKSHWIRDNGLEPYSIEPDKIRLLFASPELNSEGTFAISGKKDHQVWQHIHSLLEKRMQEGHFTIIDAMHLTPRSVKQYEKLAQQYRYATFYYQPEVTVDQCLAHNRLRAEYKQLPDHVIEECYHRMQTHELKSKWQRITDINEIKNYVTLDFDAYTTVKVVGDLQGCATVTKEALLNDQGELDSDTAYVFVGDYIDRGIENYQTLQFLMSIAHLPNVILLEGNHDAFIQEFADKGHADYRFFNRWTLPELIKDITGIEAKTIGELPSEAKQQVEGFQKLLKQLLLPRLRQCCLFTFAGNKYLVTHAGVSSPRNVTFIATQQMIHGVGKYEFEIGKAYEENYAQGNCDGIIQLHGHRKVQTTEHSICLEDGVEFGNNLVIADISHAGIQVNRYHNTVFKDWTNILPMFAPKKRDEKTVQPTDCDIVNGLLDNKMVKSKYVPTGLISINFTNKAFFKSVWNDFTIKSRGLFVDEITGKVKMRSYNKFFNTGELPSVYGRDFSYNTLVYPVRLWQKENGFLGIMSAIDGHLVLASKSMTQGQFASYFKELWSQESEEFQQHTLDILSKHNASLVFEVIHNDDPHIVDYHQQERLVILDGIENTLNFGDNNLDIAFSERVVDDLQTVATTFCEYKELHATVHTADELRQAIKEADDLPTEGFVAEDSSGFLFKYKAKFYSEWKRRRGLVARYLKKGSCEFARCANDDDKEFMSWIDQQGVEFVQGKSIIELRKYYLA